MLLRNLFRSNGNARGGERKMEDVQSALGMIETWGIPALIAAADAAVKTADVRVTTYEKADAGLVTVYIRGDVSSVKAAVDAGAAAAQAVGKLISAHVIPRPDAELVRMLQPKEAEASHKGERHEASEQAPRGEGGEEVK
jgi:microcompartment protein CcmL/EutN